MSETAIQRVWRFVELAFVTAVTACLLAFVFVLAARGPAALPGAVVYAFAAGFGLEFVASTWRILTLNLTLR